MFLATVLLNLIRQQRVVLNNNDPVTVISSVEQGDIDIRYTITVYSDVEIMLKPYRQAGLYLKTVIFSRSLTAA